MSVSECGKEGGREGEGGGADTELKTKTPHVNVGKRTGSSSVLFHYRSAGTDQRCSRSWLSRLQYICKYVPTCFSTEVDAFVLTKRFGFGRADTTLAGGGDISGRP